MTIYTIFSALILTITLFHLKKTQCLSSEKIQPSSSSSSFPQMKVHPVPGKRVLTLRYDVASALAHSNTCRQKKLRRLPHIFEKVLELPFHSDAEITVDETSDCLKFIAATNDITAGGVRADAIEIYPGVTKIVIRGNGIVDLSGTEFEDLWRFRLPACTRPELASAVYDDGELVVTVPKGGEVDEDEDEDRGVDAGSLVFVL